MKEEEVSGSSGGSQQEFYSSDFFPRTLPTENRSTIMSVVRNMKAPLSGQEESEVIKGLRRIKLLVAMTLLNVLGKVFEKLVVSRVKTLIMIKA